MRVEKLFSKLEHKTALIVQKISEAVSKSHDQMDIFEKEVHVPFKFMYLSCCDPTGRGMNTGTPFGTTTSFFSGSLTQHKIRAF
jgi:hypothetical protein